MRLTFMVAIAALLTLVSAEAASAASCSGWRATCMSRASARGAEFAQSFAPQCEAKFSACLSSGCFTEGAQFGGATHCGLTQK
jgi:hypothetical protein